MIDFSKNIQLHYMKPNMKIFDIFSPNGDIK